MTQRMSVTEARIATVDALNRQADEKLAAARRQGCEDARVELLARVEAHVLYSSRVRELALSAKLDLPPNTQASYNALKELLDLPLPE